ncbi:tRNA (adenosine(37)-N6)-threonylcarbamoyltransferase complex ATPase subunit type 1 TsaE [Neolewinella litorea]|uniref:tRNA threonylcarbamoyladenosine biosynthesis protein TsaE n=1 Tax=Neolewinella litorea TaxID=2562452 RepID=A0A4S4NG18_9BACT|nr:tRNA (adenosine(37)-N6)-threonylcarbamoyltransferase complex ATPase subunit type 1 TsaE [Neolewinella litorea]THH37755.1 tRNA (adenosine(37)-N6)-threonylcarbamoyltransferase complex ATPase subunit type 1 TsaE [Neolewinella litorea]
MEIWYSLQDLPDIAARLLREWGRDRVFALTGELGAGKTTLVAELCRQLGVETAVSSPTFSIVNEYAGRGGVIYHLDCYRLEDVEEAIAAGLEELLAEAPGAVFVEWPAVIEPLLPPDVVFLRLGHDPQGGEQRHLSITGGEPAS